MSRLLPRPWTVLITSSEGHGHIYVSPLMFAFSVSKIWIRHYVLEKGIINSGETLPFDLWQLCSSGMGFFLGGGEGTGFDQTTVCGFMGQINPELGKQMCSHYPSTLWELDMKFQGWLCVLCELSFRVLETHLNSSNLITNQNGCTAVLSNKVVSNSLQPHGL